MAPHQPSSLDTLNESLNTLLKSLPPHPVQKAVLDDLVSKALEESSSRGSSDIRKSQWEFLLKKEIFRLAATERKALDSKERQTYYDDLRDRLDIILAFTEHDACEQTFPFVVLQDLLEAQTVTSCSEIFSWIESQAARLTVNLVPQKGKALILLRTLNDLLRRISKAGSTTTFCGRILTFLSNVFPLGERSGVNLRGEYGPTWEGVAGYDGQAEDMMDAVPTDPKLAEKEEFYKTFWSLQLPFSKPTTFTMPTTFPQFKDAVNRVLPVIKEATAKDRAMMGSRAGTSGAGTQKRKREEPDELSNTTEYFFAKFLTSPDLLDLEIADTHFRRQFLFQLLILLNHLLNFTKAAKAAWATSRNRSLQMDFVLEPPEAQWVQETITKAMEELRQTTPNGRAFADTVGVILEREKNWVRWKNEVCAPFDKDPWSEEMDSEKIGLFEATADVRGRMQENPPEWQWRLGSGALTEIWDFGYRELSDLQHTFDPGDMKIFLKKVKAEDARIAMRERTLAATRLRAAAAATPKIEKVEDVKPSEPMDESSALNGVSQPRPGSTSNASSLHPSLPARPGSTPTVKEPESSHPTPTPTPAPPAPPITNDPIITSSEESKQRWTWLALRTARDQYLQHFGKIGTGDIEALVQEIEKEKQEEKDKPVKTDDTAANGVTDEQGGAGTPQAANGIVAGDGGQKLEGDGDVKMEEH